jgi:hypothetical protein
MRCSPVVPFRCRTAGQGGASGPADRWEPAGLALPSSASWQRSTTSPAAAGTVPLERAAGAALAAVGIRRAAAIEIGAGPVRPFRGI